MDDVVPKLPWRAILAVFGIALLAFGRTLDGGMLSDDLLLNALCDTDAPDVRVVWSDVFADFARPWLGFDVPYYRPMLSVSFAIDQTLGGGAPWPFHVTNVVLHALLAATTAALAALVVRERPRTAAWLAGLVVAIHPIAAEPVAWIAARNSELEVALRTGALLAYAFHVRERAAGRRGPRGRGIALVLAAAALATKESAVVVPLGLVAVDLLVAHRATLRERGARLAPFAVLLAFYFVLRVVLLGTLVGDPGSAPDGSVVDRCVDKLLALVAGLPTWALPVYALVILGAIARGPRLTTIVVLWTVVEALPTFRLELTANLGGSRMMYGALPVLGLGIAAALTALPAPRIVLAIATVMLGAWAPRTWAQLDAFDAAWRDVAEARAGIEALADRTSTNVPLALVAMPPNAEGIPPFNPNAWFPLAQRPQQPSDVPVVSLGYITIPVPKAEALVHDASATRALGELGATIATWDQKSRRFLTRHRDAAPFTAPPLVAEVDRPGRFRFAGQGVDPERVEALHVDVDGTPASLTLRIVSSVELPAELGARSFGAGTSAGDGARYEIDLSHDLTLASLATLGLPLLGFDVETGDGAACRTVTAFARVPELTVATRLDGAAGGFDRLATLTAPPVPEGATSLRLVVLGPHAALPIPCTPGQPVVVPPDIAAEFAGFLRISRVDRLWFWFEALGEPGKGGFARSSVDSFVARTR